MTTPNIQECLKIETISGAAIDQVKPMNTLNMRLDALDLSLVGDGLGVFDVFIESGRQAQTNSSFDGLSPGKQNMLPHILLTCLNLLLKRCEPMIHRGSALVNSCKSLFQTLLKQLESLFHLCDSLRIHQALLDFSI